jgi:pyruvate dehydrogenase E1 component beta subunit
MDAAALLQKSGVSAEVIDLRVVNPLCMEEVVESVKRTHRLLVIDGGWSCCGLAGEIIAGVVERVPVGTLVKSPARVTLPPAPAPTSRVLEATYYPTAASVAAAATNLMR